MAMSRKDYELIATTMRTVLHPHVRVQFFNEIVPQLRKGNDRFKVSVFYDWVFSDMDDTRIVEQETWGSRNIKVEELER